jgi:hypothetical protein
MRNAAALAQGLLALKSCRATGGKGSTPLSQALLHPYTKRSEEPWRHSWAHTTYC